MKRKFVYKDNSKWPDVKVIYECVAEGQAVADKKYYLVTGDDPFYQPSVGCVAEEL